MALRGLGFRGLGFRVSGLGCRGVQGCFALGSIRSESRTSMWGSYDGELLAVTS